VKDSLPKYCRVIEKRLKDNTTQRFIVGNKMTIADIDNAHVAYSYFFNKANKFHMQQADVVKDFPTLNKYYEDLKEELKDHFEKRPAPRPF